MQLSTSIIYKLHECIRITRIYKKYPLEELFPINRNVNRGITIDVDVGNNPIKFFFFGCWNDKIEKTEQIIKSLDMSFQFGLINGDNFYPTKTEKDGVKEKTYDMGRVERGFKILRIFPNNIYMSLGNHEVDNPTICSTLITEIEHTHKTNLMIPSNYYGLNVSNMKGDKMTVIILDVNLLETNLCYDDVSREIHKIKMLDWFRSKIEYIKTATEISTYVVMGHYPLFFVNKKGVFKVNETTIEILEILRGLSKPVYYLASDVHNFQHIIHRNIHQFIVGTGGAKLDDLIETVQTATQKAPIEFPVDGEKYTIIQANRTDI